ncbi:hypothetical protein QFC19_004455 [Naganishia cerealis]|uniref:Uncharacterized protein n=1 Tax=Naganishia cerealis TaxID=610337 RepID=A0ACC2VW69_9TREE|nr:hypothetical protein QFC19_004455 [Naganishia cerealis]
MTLPAQDLRFPSIRGFNIWYQIGSGGFSKVFVASSGRSPGQGDQAAVKLVFLSPPNNPALGNVQVASSEDVKLLKKEVQVHRTMKHPYVLEFIDSLLVDHRRSADVAEVDGAVVPGLYMLLELAVGGDLFDKIAPDVGVSDQLGQWYFSQLISGLETSRSLISDCVPFTSTKGKNAFSPADAGVYRMSLPRYALGRANTIEPGIRGICERRAAEVRSLDTDIGRAVRPTQITRSELGRELTRGLRQTGHMDLVNPPLSQPTRAANASQFRSQYAASQMSQMTSQFMRATGMVAEQSDGTFIDHRQLNKFSLHLPQDEAANRILQCVVQLVDQRNLQVDQTIKLQVRDSRKQWMRGEIRILDGAYGEESTLVEVVKTGGDPLEWRRFFWKLTKMADLHTYIVK